jgi:p-aminobenzoyl-glutamate transporter AbgT
MMTTPQVASTVFRPKSPGANTVEKHQLYALVSIVFIVTTACTILIAMGRDTGALLTLIGAVVVPILAALTYGEIKANRQATATVQQQTNGGQTKMMEIIEQQGRLLAQMQPPADDRTDLK